MRTRRGRVLLSEYGNCWRATTVGSRCGPDLFPWIASRVRVTLCPFFEGESYEAESVLCRVDRERLPTKRGNGLPGLLPLGQHGLPVPLLLRIASRPGVRMHPLAPRKFTLDMSAFLNSPGSTTFSLSVDPNSNLIDLAFVPVTEPNSAGVAMLIAGAGLAGTRRLRRRP
jgi:hypothetical protein